MVIWNEVIFYMCVVFELHTALSNKNFNAGIKSISICVNSRLTFHSSERLPSLTWCSSLSWSWVGTQHIHSCTFLMFVLSIHPSNCVCNTYNFLDHVGIEIGKLSFMLKQWSLVFFLTPEFWHVLQWDQNISVPWLQKFKKIFRHSHIYHGIIFVY